MASDSDVVMDTAAMWTSSPFPSSSQLQLGLREMERSLRCPICTNFFHVPVSLQSCHHSFCSECIRGYVATFRARNRHTKCPCPSCKQPMDVSGRDLKRCVAPNRTLESLVGHFRAIRVPLRDRLTNNSTLGGESNNWDSAEAAKKGRPTRTSKAGPAMDVTKAGHSSEREELRERRPKLPTAVYKGMKKAKLAELCRKEGLNTTGSDQDLLQRHRNFIRLYNSESDSYAPRAREELVREIHRREANKKKEAIQSRKTCGEDSEANEYVRSLCRNGKGSTATESACALVENNFKDMIAKLRAQTSKQEQAVSSGLSSHTKGKRQASADEESSSMATTEGQTRMQKGGDGGPKLDVEVPATASTKSLGAENDDMKIKAKEIAEKSYSRAARKKHPSISAHIPETDRSVSTEKPPSVSFSHQKPTSFVYRGVTSSSSEPIDLTTPQPCHTLTSSGSPVDVSGPVKPGSKGDENAYQSACEIINVPATMLPSQVIQSQTPTRTAVSPSPGDSNEGRGEKRRPSDIRSTGRRLPKKPATARTIRASKPGAKVPWRCSYCTLVNEKYTGFCEACQKTRRVAK